MSDTNNKPAAEQKETEITLKELLNISDTIAYSVFKDHN